MAAGERGALRRAAPAPLRRESSPGEPVRKQPALFSLPQQWSWPYGDFSLNPPFYIFPQISLNVPDSLPAPMQTSEEPAVPGDELRGTGRPERLHQAALHSCRDVALRKSDWRGAESARRVKTPPWCPPTGEGGARGFWGEEEKLGASQNSLLLSLPCESDRRDGGIRSGGFAQYSSGSRLIKKLLPWLSF